MKKNKNKQKRTIGETARRQQQKSLFFSTVSIQRVQHQPKEFPCTESKEEGGGELSKK